MDFFKNPKMFWALWISGAAVWQARALATQNGGTGSETTRSVLRVDTIYGKWAFLMGYALFTAWFPRHILKPLVVALNDSLDTSNISDSKIEV